MNFLSVGGLYRGMLSRRGGDRMYSCAQCTNVPPGSPVRCFRVDDHLRLAVGFMIIEGS